MRLLRAAGIGFGVMAVIQAVGIGGKLAFDAIQRHWGANGVGVALFLLAGALLAALVYLDWE